MRSCAMKTRPAAVGMAFGLGIGAAVERPEAARAELQAFVDEHLGRGLVVLDGALDERTLLHEASHAFQLTVVGGLGGVPDFGSAASLADVARHPSFDLAQTAQGAALHAALKANTVGETVAAVERFQRARDDWRAIATRRSAPPKRSCSIGCAPVGACGRSQEASRWRRCCAPS